MVEQKEQEQQKVQQTQQQQQQQSNKQQEDQRITGEDWKLDLSQEDRDIANEVEGKLKEVQKQIDMIESKTRALQNRMNFPFGIGSQTPQPKIPNQSNKSDNIGDNQNNNDNVNQSNEDEAKFDEPQLPKISYKDFPVIDARGNLITSKEIAIEKYHNSLPFFRCLELPFCYTQIKKKYNSGLLLHLVQVQLMNHSIRYNKDNHQRQYNLNHS